jgi:hypothetical protein
MASVPRRPDDHVRVAVAVEITPAQGLAVRGHALGLLQMEGLVDGAVQGGAAQVEARERARLRVVVPTSMSGEACRR